MGWPAQSSSWRTPEVRDALGWERALRFPQQEDVHGDLYRAERARVKLRVHLVAMRSWSRIPSSWRIWPTARAGQVRASGRRGNAGG